VSQNRISECSQLKPISNFTIPKGEDSLFCWLLKRPLFALLKENSEGVGKREYGKIRHARPHAW
jgi:hypothetical protein